MEVYSLKKDVKKLFKQKENNLRCGVIQCKVLSKSFFMIVTVGGKKS